MTAAVVDRSGNVLAVFQTSNASQSVTVSSQRNTGTGLDGLTTVPAASAAIAKAITGAYLSSEGNAFSTRTASQMVQEHFNPGDAGQPSGPLFGVQFSSLPCSDLNTRYSGGVPDIGPKRSPLGLSADPGGFPLYKNGTVVGGVGIIADGLYSLDLTISVPERNLDELIAIAATSGFDAPAGRRADVIAIGGLTLRYTDVEVGDTATGGRNTLSYATASAAGTLLAVPGYSAATIAAGTYFAQPQSGYAAANDAAFSGLDAFQMMKADGITPRYSPQAGGDGLLSAAEVTELLKDAIAVANNTRAEIRQPANSQLRASVAVVDTQGNILGVLHTRDAPVFGSDVAVQKARTAVFFSSAGAGASLQAAGSVNYLTPGGSPGNPPVAYSGYVQAMTALAGTNALDGSYAYSLRAIGNLARPFFPDGADGSPNGPLSKPYPEWSPFSTGLQLDLDYERIVQHQEFVLGQEPDTGASCAGAPGPVNGFDTTVPATLGDGLQIFAGGVPIYRGNTLVGGIGVSGDGIDEDDMVAFLGLDQAGQVLGTVNNAPSPLRIDTLDVGQLQYVVCPQAPFLDNSEQNPCDGK
jgi:uncharacterized protein GlcG (DUF336 family)